MAEYKSNELTQLAEEQLSSIDTDYENIPGKEYIESLNIVTNFYDYTYYYAQKNGFDGDKNDANSLAKFIFNLSNERNAALSSLKTVKNWLTSSPPAKTQAGRENVYTLCFALGLNATETKEFFLKAYLERPFNYKNIHEAIYFFCLNTGLGYQDAKRIIDKVESSPIIENDDAENITEQIGYALSTMGKEDDVVAYLVNNRCGFAIQNQTATEKIRVLIEECKKLAELEFSKYADPNASDKDSKFSVTTIDDLLRVIYGYAARSQKGKDKTAFSISNSNLPDLIKSNFPQRQQFENILVGKALFDVIRKALIMLNFYHFFTDAYLNREESNSYYLYEEFVDETNALLSECGYVQLYWRNPYDWMFGYCAYSSVVGEYPVDQLRLLIEEFYLKHSNPEGMYYDETDFTNTED